MGAAEVLSYGSLFSGAGGADIGFERAGLECRWQCEIDPQASAVLAKHWPKVKRFGDIREVGQKDLGAVDVVVGGFPCQGFSIAGKGEGLRDDRSGLFYELLRVVRLCRPRFVVWENVPGLLSSDGGRDFGRVLRGLAECGYFGAWRVLDSQFFGSAQRRKRVFGVFARGHRGAVRSAEVLALTKGVRRHPAKGKKAGQEVAFTLTSTVGRNGEGSRAGNAWNTNFVAGTLTARTKEKAGHNARDEAGLTAARCLTSRGQRNDSESDNLIAHTLTGVGFDASEDGTGRGSPLLAVRTNQTGANGHGVSDKAHSLDTSNGQAVLAFNFKQGGDTALGLSEEGKPPLRTNGDLAMQGPMGVRRLTPREWERLMTWPDDWTRYGAAGEEFKDGPRYRMCGNGVVANVAEWLAKRLVEVS